MKEKIKSRIGQILADIPPSLYVIVIGGLLIYTLLPSVEPKTSTVSNSKISADINNENRCKSQREEQLSEYEKNIKLNQPWKAATTIRVCSKVLNDPQMLSMVKQAELSDRMNTAYDKSAPASHRLMAIGQIEEMDPTKIESLKALKIQMQKIVNQQDSKNRKSIATQKRNEGVVIGMTQADVVASSWGRPKKINKSIYSFGVHEQWVYEGNNYLYFRDGKLDSIQTSN